ncbi:hypothetical protein [Rhizobium mongolense]
MSRFNAVETKRLRNSSKRLALLPEAARVLEYEDEHVAGKA